MFFLNESTTFWERYGGLLYPDQSGTPDSNPRSPLVEATKVHEVRCGSHWWRYDLSECSLLLLVVVVVAAVVVAPVVVVVVVVA